jgi:hypothetical protein
MTNLVDRKHLQVQADLVLRCVYITGCPESPKTLENKSYLSYL